MGLFFLCQVLKSVNAGVSYCLKVYYCAVQLTQTKTHTMTTSKNFSKNGKAYNALLSHCNKQYKNVAEITKAYIISGQVYAIDYISTIGKQQIASNTAIAESVITFK